MPPFFSIAETAPVVSFSQPSKTASSVHAEFRVAYESNVFLMQLPSISANKLEHYRRTRVGVVHDKVVLSAGRVIFISNTYKKSRRNASLAFLPARCHLTADFHSLSGKLLRYTSEARKEGHVLAMCCSHPGICSIVLVHIVSQQIR